MYMVYIQPMRTRYPTVAEARSSFKEILDAAEQGLAVEFTRGTESFTVLSVASLTHLLGRPGVLPRPVVYAEDEGWSIVLPGAPVAAAAGEFGDALDDFVAALREYADDWMDDAGLRAASSHRDNADLVRFVSHLGDDAVREWVIGAADEPSSGG